MNNLIEMLMEDASNKDATFKVVERNGHQVVESTHDESTPIWQLWRNWRSLEIGDVEIEDLGDWHKVSITLTK